MHTHTHTHARMLAHMHTSTHTHTHHTQCMQYSTGVQVQKQTPPACRCKNKFHRLAGAKRNFADGRWHTNAGAPATFSMTQRVSHKEVFQATWDATGWVPLVVSTLNCSCCNKSKKCGIGAQAFSNYLFLTCFTQISIPSNMGCHSRDATVGMPAVVSTLKCNCCNETKKQGIGHNRFQLLNK